MVGTVGTSEQTSVLCFKSMACGLDFVPTTPPLFRPAWSEQACFALFLGKSGTDIRTISAQSTICLIPFDMPSGW